MTEKKQIPFFKRFMENVEASDMAKTSGGGKHVTMKYPSDNDEAYWP